MDASERNPAPSRAGNATVGRETKGMAADTGAGAAVRGAETDAHGPRASAAPPTVPGEAGPTAARTHEGHAHLAALESADSSVRLRAALTAGTRPLAGDAAVLVRRCASEPDFFVRDMLTWALTRHAPEDTVPLLVEELRSPRPQARSQALHTLSKIRDPSTWTALDETLLLDSDDEVARSAWRASVVLVPDGEERRLAEVLASQLGRGDPEVQLSLSRALLALGEASEPVVRAVAEAAVSGGGASGDGAVAERARAHALATERMRGDPDLGFAVALEEAKRVAIMGTD